MLSSRKRLLASVLTAYALLPLHEPRAWAGVNAWTELGPPGATVDSLVANPLDRNEIFMLAGRRKVYRSVDGGRRWAPTGSPLPFDVFQLVACSGPQAVLAVGYSSSLRSTDRGTTWQSLPISKPVTCDAAGNLYGARGGQDPPLASSSDGGLTWTLLDPGLGRIQVMALNANPLLAGTVYARFQHLDGSPLPRLFKSETFGQSWARADSGIPEDTDVFTLLVAPAGATNTVLASSSRGIYASTDAGASWVRRSPTQILSLAAGGSAGQFFGIATGSYAYYAPNPGILNRSSDAGATWQRVNALTEPTVEVAVTVGDTNLVAGTSGGVFQSSDDGASWLLTTSDLAAARVGSLAVSPAQAGRLYAAATTGLFRSDDRGAHWTRIQGDLPAIGRVAAAPDNAALVWAAGTGALWRSENAGASWAAVPIGVSSSQRLVALQVAASDPRRILVAFETQIYTSADGGARWSSASWSGTTFSNVGSFLTDVRIDDAGTVVLAAGAGLNGRETLWRSTDGGGFFGLSLPGAFPNVTVAEPSFSPDGAVALLSSRNGFVARSSDRGETWSDVAFPGISDRFAWDTVGGLVYAVSGTTTLVSADRGLTWTPRTNPQGGHPQLPSTPVADLVVDPADPNVLYAATPFGVSQYQQVAPSGPCVADSRTLCLVDKRFKVQVGWHNQYSGASGEGGAVPRTDLTGFFYFSDPANIELILKVLPFGDTVKVFYGQLTDLEFTLTVTDTRGGQVKTYRNSAGNCGAIDQSGFPGAQGDVIAWKALAPTTGVLPLCTANVNTLCLLGGRFAVTVDWRNQFNGDTGRGSQVTLSSLSGQFYYTSPDNVELLAKVLDFGDRFLFLYGALSDLEYTIHVTDTVGGTAKTYFNPAGRYCGGLDNDLLSGGTTAPVGEVSLDAAMPAARRARRILEIRRQLGNGQAVRIAVRGDDETSADELTDALASQLVDVATVADRHPRGRFGMFVLLASRR